MAINRNACAKSEWPALVNIPVCFKPFCLTAWRQKKIGCLKLSMRDRSIHVGKLPNWMIIVIYHIPNNREEKYCTLVWHQKTNYWKQVSNTSNWQRRHILQGSSVSTDHPYFTPSQIAEKLCSAGCSGAKKNLQCEMGHHYLSAQLFPTIFVISIWLVLHIDVPPPR